MCSSRAPYAPKTQHSIAASGDKKDSWRVSNRELTIVGLEFLPRHGRSFSDGKNWTKMHERWLAKQSCAHPAQQIVFQDQLEVIAAAQARLAALEQQLGDIKRKRQELPPRTRAGWRLNLRRCDKCMRAVSRCCVPARDRDILP